MVQSHYVLQTASQRLKKVSLVILKIIPIYGSSTSAPPEFPAPVPAGAVGCHTALCPCSESPLLFGPSGVEFLRAPCGPHRPAASAPLVGPENSHFPWLPEGRQSRTERECELGDREMGNEE